MNETVKDSEGARRIDSSLQSLADMRDQFDPAKARELQQEKQRLIDQEPIESLKDFYDALSNPLNNDEKLLSVVNAYAKEGSDLGGLYGSLQKIGVEQKETGLINSTDRQRFEQKMYERWRHSVADMTKEEFINARAAGTLKNEFKYLHNFVKTHPECSTASELIAAIDQIPDKNESEAMFDCFEKYNWNLKNPGWIHVKSRYVNARQEDRIEVDHRLYLNTDSTSTYGVIDALVDTYEKNGLPYYFKFDESGKRADTIVIYTSTKDLVKNLEVIRQLKKERPELAEHFHEPPVLTGVIDGDIGYGAEPEKGSYSEVRARILGAALRGATLDWVAAHQNDEIRHGGQKMLFSDYVAKKEIKKLREDFAKRFSLHLDVEKRRQLSNNGWVDETKASEKTAERLGFSQRDLQENSKMFQFFRSQIRDNFSDIIEQFRAGGNCDFEVNGRYDKALQLGGDNFYATIRGLAPQIASHDASYLDDIRRRTHEECTKNGIDPDKFVFDESTVVKMKKQNRLDRM